MRRDKFLLQLNQCYRTTHNMDASSSTFSARTPPNKRRRKLPSIGCKINRPLNSEAENSEIHAMLLEQKELLLERKIEIDKFLISAEWDTEINEAKVIKNRGSSLSIFGHGKNRCIYLYPEETLYLIEMNKLQLFHNDVRVSIQRAYALLLNSVTNINIDCYRIFKHFAVHGYKLYRHQTPFITEVENTSLPSGYSNAYPANNIYEEYCKKLRVFSPVTSNGTTTDDGLNITYDVYSPQRPMQKSCRPEPDYYLIVIRCEEKIDSLFQLISSLNSPNLLFANASGNSISVFNMQGVQIPNLF